MIKRWGATISALCGVLLLLIAIAMVVAAWETVAEAGVILVWFSLAVWLITGAAWLAQFAWRQICQMRISNAETQLKRNETRLSDLEVEQVTRRGDFERTAMLATLPQIQHGLLYPASLGGIPFSSHSSGLARLAQQNDGVPFLGEPIILRPIIPELATRQRILVVGASDSGKTTLLRHLIDAKGSCLVIDPHGTPPKWGQVKHIGQGRDYKAISASLNWLIREMNKRYEQLGTGEVGERGHDRVTVIIDEWRAIVKNVKTAGDHISTLLTEARKTNIDLVVATHSKMVKALGIEGEGDLRKGFTVVNLYGGNGEQHRATLSTNGGEEVEFSLPGPYPNDDFTAQIATKLLPSEVESMERNGSILDLDMAPETAQALIDQQVIDEYQATGSYSAAFRLLYRLENGSDYAGAIGGNNTRRVKDILDRHNVTHPIGN